MIVTSVWPSDSEGNEEEGFFGSTQRAIELNTVALMRIKVPAETLGRRLFAHLNILLKPSEQSEEQR